MDGTDWREFLRSLAWAAIPILVLLAIAWAMVPAHSHDWKRPDLDQWYGSLRRPHVSAGGFPGCCSKTDCHTTEAELRGGDWWARVGVKQQDDNWRLLDYVKVPAEVVLQNQSNPTGEAVVCHSGSWMGTVPNPKDMTIFCFVPPTES